MQTPNSHWEDFAAVWHRVGPPLRPCPTDVDYVSSTVHAWHDAHAGRESAALILGVTPELAAMPWPHGCHVLGIDHHVGMIRRFWPAHGQPRRMVVRGDWREMPLAPHSIDVILADGCLTQLDFPAGYVSALTQAQRVLQPQGLFLARFFVQGEQAETLEALRAQLRAGAVSSFHEFKFRLALALQSEATQGIRLDDVWQAWQGLRELAQPLAGRPGWTPEATSTIEVYRASNSRYTFPTLDELRVVLSDFFVERSCVNLDYPFGANCPTLCLSPRG